LGVSESWFYKQSSRQPTNRELRRQCLVEAVKEEFDKFGGTYGLPKIFIRLVRQGWRVSVNTIANIMAELELVARKVRRWRGLTRPGKRPASPDFVKAGQRNIGGVGAVAQAAGGARSGQDPARCGVRSRLGRGLPGDVAMLRAEPAVFGPVASDPTVSRLVDTLATSGKRALTSSNMSGPWPGTLPQTWAVR
jgi:hypothetical protein